MKLFSSLRSISSMLFRRSRLERDMDEELRSHIANRTNDLMRSGLPRAEAQRRACIEFGGYQKYKEQIRESLGAHFLETLLQDLRYALRMLRKSPGFTAVAVLTLALGIGATSALFSMVEAVLLKPLPYYEASRLAVLWTDNAKQNLHQERTSFPNFEDWSRQNTTFESMAFATAFTVNVATSENAERLLAGRTSANLFSLMGVKPILGRTFSTQEEERGERVILISQNLWVRSFGSSPDVVGKSLDVDGLKMAVIGVMPATFQFPARGVDLWEPLTVFPNWSVLKARRNTPAGFVVGRLKSDVSFSRAQTDMNVIAARLAQQYPELAGNQDFFGFAINVMPFDLYITGPQVRLALWLLFGAAVLVLFIACTNVASLLLSRALLRSREFATRMALGAGRGRVIRQLLMESTVMYLISAVCGVAIAATADRLFIGLAPADVPRLHEAGIDLGVLAFALLVSFFAAVIFGLIPAWKVSATDPHMALRGSGRGLSQTSSALRLRSVLVTAELAVALILLVGAGLLIRSFSYVQRVDPGFRAAHVLTARVVQSKLKSENQWRDFYEQALQNIQVIPGLESAGAIDNFFFASFPDEAVLVEGASPPPPGTPLPQVTDDGISPDYFQSIGVPLLRGRFFTKEDSPASARTAIINATMSRRFWPDADPLGKRFKLGYQSATDPWITVVGVVGDMHRDGLTRDPVSQIFLPLSQHPARGMDLLVRTSGDPRSFATSLRHAIQSVDKSVPVFDVSTLEDALREQEAPRRFQAFLLSIFSAVSLILSAIGIFGLMHFSVTQRTHEIGIRMALGAQRSSVLRMILRDGMFLALIGVAIGISGALALTGFLRSMLFEVKPGDPATFIGVSILLALVALLACYIPARRAMKVDPMVALRYE